MDHPENSEPLENDTQSNSDNAGDIFPKVIPKQSVNGDDKNVFTSTSNQPKSSSATSNGPINSYLNSLPKNENGQVYPKINSDNSKFSSGPSHPQVSKKNNSNEYDQQQPCSSKTSDSKICDGSKSESKSCNRHKICIGKTENTNNIPSTSGTNINSTCDDVDKSLKENETLLSSFRLHRDNCEDEGSLSDHGNEGNSLGSEDECIYTYRGGEHLADLPSSFFSLDMGLPLDKHLPERPNYVARPEEVQVMGEVRSRASSPDMDFLEMDFDPGPSCEADSGDESSLVVEIEEENDINVDLDLPFVREEESNSPEFAVLKRKSRSCEALPVAAFMYKKDDLKNYDVPSTSGGASTSANFTEAQAAKSPTCGPFITYVNYRGERLLVHRTVTNVSPYVPVNMHTTGGNLVASREVCGNETVLNIHHANTREIEGGEPIDPLTYSTSLYHLNMARDLIREETTQQIEDTDISNAALGTEGANEDEDPITAEVPKTMIWSEHEACERQVTQIFPSACGETAVINVFNALGVTASLDSISANVRSRQRENRVDVPRYILTRAIAGCTAADLVSGLQRASDSQVTARFFPTFPERAVPLSHWLADWISLGAIPVLTLNLQMAMSADGEIPDAWHHQMVFGVSSRGIYLTNPLECVRESVLWPRLTSPSVLLIRTRDVLSRYSARTDLEPLMYVPDRRFHTFNVLGQVVNAIREWRASERSEHGIRTSHIRVPAAYQAGVTIAALTGSEAHRRLMHAYQLPHLDDIDK